MIRALVTGELQADPQQRTAKNGNPFGLARLSVPKGDQGRIFCSLIVFESEAVKRLMQLKSGASVAAAGTLKVGTWEAKDGAIKPSLDMVADEIASTTPRPKKPKPASAHQSHEGVKAASDPFDDDVDWMGA